MEDEERRRKLETGRAKLAEYRQRKAQSDGQKKQKKKRSKGSEQQEGGVLPEESGQRKDSSHYCLSRTIRSGETVTHDHTYTIEPESEVSTTAEDYSSEEEESRPLLNTTESQSHLQAMEDELREKNAALEELSRELDEIRAAFGTEGIQQLQDFEAALKQRDAIITQLTANLQQARTEKDDVMKEFLQLTEQSHKLQLQFQQLQAGETLRSSSISSTAADLLQTRQQVLYNQQQLEEKDTQVRGLQERLEEKDTQVKDLQEKLLQVAQLQQSLSHIQAVKREAEESFAQRLQEKDLQILQQEKLRSEQQQLLSQLQDNLQASKNNLNEISEQLAAKTRELEVCESELQTSRQKERLSSGEIQQLMGTVEDLQKRYHYKGADQGDAALKMAHLRAELDEMYGEQIVQMKQELSARHAEELAHIREQHSTELEKISENLKAKWTQSAGEANVLNARVVELQQKLQENQVLREKAEQDLAQMSEEKVFLHNRVQELVEDLRLAKQSKETEKSQMDLQVEIADLQAKLAAAQEASTELEAKHESEITNYQIKLEMLEREKDAVLDRMAESQEAELERLRTQLLFCHEEELSRLREDLQHENQMNMENLRDELRQVRNGYEAEKALLDAERASLLQEILVLKEDLSRALENSRVDELVSQLNELQTEIQELRKREGHREGTVLEGTSDSTWKDHLEAENKLLKEKEGIMVEELKSLRENREVLMKEIESFTADTEQANKLVEELKAEIERQKTTFSLAEKNFEVNYQKLREELEERIKEQMLQYEMKLQSLQTKLGTLEETDGGALVEKDTIELMEKLQEMEMVKAELEEKVEQKEMELQRIKAEKVELLKQKDMELQRVEGELQKVELEKVGLLKQKEVGLRRVKVEKAELLQKQQILALEEEVQELRRSLRSMGRDEDEDDEEGAEPVDDLLARPLAQREGEGESGERRTHTPYSASEQVGDEATEPTVTRPLRMEGSDHEECRLQMEALRISLSQIHAAQLELLKENLHKQGTVSRDEAVEQRFDQELQAQMVCDDQTERSVNVHILSAAGTELKGEEPELDRRLILEFREQRELQEQQHQQELQRLRSYYRQQVEETEERFQNEIVLLQSRLEELSGTSAVYSVQRVSPPVHQGAELLQDEVERVRERVSEERARDTEDLQRDEDIAKVIVQMCVEFAQQTELTRISRESENQERERLQEEIRFLQEKLDTLESLTQTQQDTSPEDQEGPHWAEHEEEEEVSEGEHKHQEDEDQEHKVRVDGPEGECGDLQVRRDSDQSKDEDRTLSSFTSGEDEEDHDETGENGEKVYDRKGSGPPSEGSRKVHGGDKRKNKGQKGDHTQCSGDQRRGSQDHKDDSGNYYKETSREDQKECCRGDQRDDSGRHQREDSIGDQKECCRGDQRDDSIGDPKEEFVDHVKDFGGDSRVNTRIEVSGNDQRKKSGEVLKEGSRDPPRGGSVAMSKSHEEDDDEDDEDEEDVGGVDEARALLAQLKYKLALQAEEHALVLEELRSSHILQVERNQDQLTQLTAHLHFLSTHLEQQGAEQKQRMDGAQEESSRSEMQHPSMQSSGTQTLDSTHTTSGEGDEEEEKMEKEKEGVMSQLSSQDTERDLLRKANVKLCKVLMDVLKTTAATEETIGRHIEPQRDVSSQSLPSSEVTQEDTSVFSVETETDEGLEMSQMMLEAGLQPEGCGLQLEEANLQLEREEYLSTISSRLQSAVEKLLFTITETTSQLEHARLTQTELIKEKFRHAEEISELLRRQEELQEKLQEEASARQHLALQLHDAEGLIDGYSGERRALEQQLRERAELQLQLEQELQVTTNRLQELEQERNNVHHQRELLQRQQEAMRDGVSGRELRLVEAAGDAAPEADLLEETEKLMQEKVEVQLQAEKDHSELLQQVKHLEVELEEQEGRFTELEEAHRAETADFTQQISALEKQLENNRRFLDEQAVDREHERDVFQQEIQKLEQQLKNVPKPQPSSDQHLREVEELSGALKEKTDWCSELLLKVEQLQREVEEREEEIQKLESHNRELIANSLTLKSEEESKQYACMATGDDVTLESLLQTEREALDRKEKEIVNLEEQLEQFREELQNKSEEVQQLHMQLEIQRKEIHTQQQELHTQSHLHTVLEQKDREIILLSEHIAKLQLTQSSPDHQEVEEKSEELEAQVEYLRGEQERLKRDNEEEVERLNSVIEKLQQDLANIQHKQSLEEEEELKQKLEEELKEKMEEGLKQKMEEELKQDLKQRLEMELEQRMEEEMKQRMEEEQRPRMEEKLKQKMEEELKLDLKQRMEEEQKPRMEEELKQDLKNKMEVLKQRMEEELKQKMEDELKQDLKQKMEELRPSMQEELKLKMEEELKQDLNQKMEDLRPRMEEELKQKMEDELKQDQKQKMEELRPRMEEELKQKMEDGLKQDLKQKMDELRPRMEEQLKLKMEEELKQDLKQKMEELRPRMEEELKQKMEKDLNQKMEELRPRMEEELKQKMEDGLKQDLKQKMEELRPRMEEELKLKMEEELKQDLNQKMEELKEEELKQKMEKDLKQKMEELKQRMEEEQRPSLEEELKQKMEDKLTQELKHKTEEVKHKMEEELKQDLKQNIEKELMQKMDEELKQKMDEVMKELDSLKVEHSSLLVSYESLQLEAMERYRQGDRSLVSLQESLQDALRERSAALLVAQAQVQALEESANSRMMDLTQRIEELQECVEEKEMELHACRLQVQRAKDDAQTLNLKISQLEDKLREKVAAVLVTQAQLEAVQVQAQTKEHHMDEEELELEEAAEDLTSEEIRKRNLCNPENFEHLGKEGRVGYLSEKLLGLEQGLSSMLRDQELQKELLNSSEEEVQEYHQRLNSLLELLQQLRTTSAPTSAQAVSDGGSEMETVLQELQHVKDKAAETKGELNTCRERNLKLQEQIQMKEAVIEKLEEELQKASECEEDSRSASSLLQELQQVKDEAAETKEELTTCRELSLKLQEQIQEREMTIALLKDQLHRASGEVETSELLQELQEVREQAAEAKEELNSYIECSQKLQEQIQARDLSIAQMMEELQQLRSALSKPSEDTPASSQSRKKSAKHGEGKGKSSSAVAKDKLSVSRKSSDRSSNGSQTRSDAETQVQRNEQVSQELQEVISQYTERIGQMRELHAAEIMDMENRHISESESLKRENQRLEEECNALRATLNNIHTNEAVRLDLPASSQFRDGYASDSSSEWSQRTGFDPPHLQGEFRSTPEGARRDDSDIMSHRIKTLLREVHQEGMQVLSLSEISVPEAEHSSEQLPLEVWRREKEALLDNVESLKTLITQLQMHSQSQSETQTAGDWRADLLRAVQQVFLRERQVLKITLLTQLDLLDTRDSIIHLNQLERVLTEQDAVHQEALSSLQSADRHSLLSEISHLRAQLQHLQQAMPIPQQATPLSQQNTLPHLVDVTGMSEAQQKMGREKDGERDRQREEKVPPAVEDLKGELAQTKLELELSLKTQSKHLKELETLRAELCVKSSELDAQTDRLSEEQKRARELQWALEREKNRAERREEGEREELEDLRLALEDQKTHVSDLSLSLEEEKKVSSRLREERDGEISKQININSELQVQLDAQKLQVVELSSSLQKEKEMNVQMLKQLQFSSSESQRPLQAMSEEGVDQAEASCSQVEEGVACVELLLQSLQDQLSEKQKTLAETMEKLEVQKLQEVQVKGAFAQERTEMSRRLQEATESLNALHTRAQELQTLLDGERERGTRLERERDTLQRRVSEVMERSQRDNQQAALRGAEGHSADRTRDWVLQQKAEESGNLTSSSAFGVDAAGQTTGQNKNLDNVVNRLQLIASRINTMTSSASSLPQEGPDREALSWLHSNVQDVLTLLQPTQTAPPAVPESATLLTGGSSSALTERLLRQNAELTGFVSRLTEEKNELRNQLLRLEEELRRQRHLSTHSSVKSGSEGQELVLFSGERESWMREKKRLEKSLRETEAELSRLRGEMRSDTIRDITTSDTDNTALKRMYGKYLRAESFRKALIYQKKYLLLLLGGFQECEEATLSLIARMGGRPSYPQLDTITQRRRGFTRFRSAVRVSIALSRMRFLVRRWKKASGGSLMSPTIISRNGLGQSPGTEGRNDSPYLQPSVEQYGERRGTNRTGRESPRAGHYTHHRCGVAAGDGGSVLCSHLQNYDPDRALSDYISRLEALQRRLGSVQSGSSSYAQLHFGIRR